MIESIIFNQLIFIKFNSIYGTFWVLIALCNHEIQYCLGEKFYARSLKISQQLSEWNWIEIVVSKWGDV